MATTNSNSSLGIVNVSLTSSDILNLFTTPVTLLPARSGIIYRPISVDWIYTFGTIQYVATNFYISTKTAADPNLSWFVVLGSKFVGKSTSVHTVDNGGGTEQNISSPTLTDFINQPVLLATDSAPTSGDGTARVNLIYAEYKS